MKLNEKQLQQVDAQVKRLLKTDSFYSELYRKAGITGVSSQEDFEKLPFSSKDDLRDAYPLGIQAVPEEEVVRIHSSSGTTGKPVIIPYTAKDVDDWAIMFARCYETAGITNKDRVQITPAYGLWTAGIGFQNGAEKLGAMAIPMGPGNTDKQIQMMIDLKSTVLTATSSYAIHYWDDYIYIEIIDPATGEPVADGEPGEIVITTLVKEGAPLLRFRTHDLSRIIPEKCSCGRSYPRLDTIGGRSDDMFKVRGVNMFPRQVEELLQDVDGVLSEYNITIAHDEDNNKDIMILTVEVDGRVDFEKTALHIRELFKSRIGMTPKVTAVPVGTLQRSEKKTKRVIDYRYQ